MNQDCQYIPLEDNENYFYSYDIALCAYLLCEYFELCSLDKTLRNKVMFVMRREKKRDIDVFVRSFWNSEKALVDAQTYFNQLKRLKNQIHSY